MALLELLYEHCALNCVNKEYGCNYLFTGRDKNEYWIHVQDCPFKKLEGSVSDNEKITQKKKETYSQCSSEKEKSIEREKETHSQCIEEIVHGSAISKSQPKISDREHERTSGWSSIKYRKDHGHSDICNGKLDIDADNQIYDTSKEKSNGQPTAVMSNQHFSNTYSPNHEERNRKIFTDTRSYSTIDQYTRASTSIPLDRCLNSRDQPKTPKGRVTPSIRELFRF